MPISANLIICPSRVKSLEAEKHCLKTTIYGYNMNANQSRVLDQKDICQNIFEQINLTVCVAD